MDFDALDALLSQHDRQSTTEGADYVPEECARCTRRPVDGDGALCAPCRAYLAGETDDDPDQTKEQWHRAVVPRIPDDELTVINIEGSTLYLVREDGSRVPVGTIALDDASFLVSPGSHVEDGELVHFRRPVESVTVTFRLDDRAMRDLGAAYSLPPMWDEP